MEFTIKMSHHELHEAIRTGTLQALSEALAESNDKKFGQIKEELLPTTPQPEVLVEEPVTTEESDNPIPTIEEVRAALKEADEAGIEVKSFISAFGVKNLSAIPKERYPELLERLRDVMEVHNG